MNLNLRNKILFPILALFLTVVVSVGFLAVQRSGALFRERSAQAMDLDVQTSGASINNWAGAQLRDLQAWASLEFVKTAIVNPSARSFAGEQLAKINKLYPLCQSVNLLDSVGMTIAAAMPGRVGKSFADRDYFKKAIVGEPNIMDANISRITGLPVVTMAAPAAGTSQKPSGVLYTSISLERFGDMFLKSFSVDSFSYAFVFQLSNGIIVSHPDTSLVLKVKLDSTEVGAHVRRSMEQHTAVVAEIGGRMRQVGFAEIPSTRWGLAVVHDIEGENARMASTRWLVLGIAFGAALIAFLLVFLIVQPMVASLKEAVVFARAVEDGDISKSLQARSKDEIGDLVNSLVAMGASLRAKAQVAELVAQRDLSVDVRPASPKDALGNALKVMVANLREVLGRTAEGARESTQAAQRFQVLSEGLAGAAEETSAQAKVVTDATEQVHRSVQSVAAGAEEMGSSIREIARSASEAASIAASAVERVRLTNALVEKLGESSNEIGSIIGVIQGIAGQTNLLALNATIEAARAGEAGKGFAVVAGEVKELSKATREATESIQGRILSIQSEMTAAIESIRSIGEVIQDVNNISHSIASAVEEQTAATSEITRSIADASRGIGEISSGVQQVSLAANSTAKSAAEINADSLRLRINTAELSDSIGSFKLS